MSQEYKDSLVIGDEVEIININTSKTFIGRVVGCNDDELQISFNGLFLWFGRKSGCASGDYYIQFPHDNVNQPKHYTRHPSGIECIQVTEHMNFCRGNAIKYLWRCGEKGDAIEDLEIEKKEVARLRARLSEIEPPIVDKK